MKVQDKVFAVTGGGDGIGREVVLGLLRRGARVAALDLREDALATTEALANAGERLSTHVVDVSDRQAVAELPAAVLAAHGQIDGLLNVAGIIQRFEPVTELSYQEMEKVLDVNLWGVLQTCKEFLPHLAKRPEACIVNVSSMGGFLPVPGQTVYGASKAAVKLFTEGLYAEQRDTPLAVTIVYPGAIGTAITTNSGVSSPGGEVDAEEAARRTTPAPDAAEQIIREAVEQGRYRVLVGKDASMLDRLSRLNPRRATDLIAKKMASLVGSSS